MVGSNIKYCVRCNASFEENEKMVCSGPQQFWHLECFVCAQCFRPFGEHLEHYQFAGKFYCERDFRTLFAPCCEGCNNFIIGRFLRACNKCWHPNCFKCRGCEIPLADHGYKKDPTNPDVALCYSCYDIARLRKATQGRHVCFKCKTCIDPSELNQTDLGSESSPLRFNGETYHAYHFNCQTCGIELRPDAKEINGELHCTRCHDQMNIPICGACRMPVEERVVTALGKHWHVNHFCCTICERPFLGKRHFEVKGSAYCQDHYDQLFGHRCRNCCQVIKGDIVSALGNFYCPEHFKCDLCQGTLPVKKSKFFDVQSNICCMKCYRKLPGSFRKSLAKQQKLDKKKRNLMEKQHSTSSIDYNDI